MPTIHINKNSVKFASYYNGQKIPRYAREKCGAKTRKNMACQAPPVWNKILDKARNGRCKLHGGLSTGPKTEIGKQAIRISNKRRNRKSKIFVDEKTTLLTHKILSE